MISYADHDFTKATDVRIVANGNKLWIALDGQKVLEITDAEETSLYKGAIRFYGVQGDAQAELKMVSLRVFSANEAEDGIKPAEAVDADVIMTREKMINALIRSGAYILNGDVLNNISNMDSKSISFTDEQNFILNFKIKMAEKAAGSLQIRIRAKNLEKNTQGYRVFISKNKIEIAKFNDDNWASKTIKSVKHSFTETSEVRIAANGSVIWIAVDGKKIIQIDDAITVEGGQVLMYGLVTDEICELLPVSLLKYSDIKAGDGIKEQESEEDNDKAVLKPLRSTTQLKESVNDLGDKSDNNLTLIIVISVCAALVIVSVITVLFLIKKKQKSKISRT